MIPFRSLSHGVVLSVHYREPRLKNSFSSKVFLVVMGFLGDISVTDLNVKRRFSV